MDSSAAAIGAQGLLRLGALLAGSDAEAARRYTQAGLTMARWPCSCSAWAEAAGSPSRRR